jgi:hypothetical protein
MPSEWLGVHGGRSYGPVPRGPSLPSLAVYCTLYCTLLYTVLYTVHRFHCVWHFYRLPPFTFAAAIQR